MNLNEFLKLIEEGENQRVEFKPKITSEAAKDAVAFLNTRKGFLLFGISDDGKIIGLKPGTNWKKEIEEKIIQPIYPKPKFTMQPFRIQDKLIVALILQPNGKIYSYKNVAYVRIGSLSLPLTIDEVITRAAESILIRFDSVPNPDASIKDLSIKKIEEFLKTRSKRRGGPLLKPTKSIMRKLKIIHDESPTNGGLLFFGKNPQQFFPYAKIRLEFFSSAELENPTAKFELEGDLKEQVDRAYKILMDEIPRESYLPEGALQRIERPIFPIPPLREAILNAIIHRNYFIPVEINIFVFKDRIEIRNPGRFPPGTSPEKPIHIPRNPLLASLFYDIGYVERYGIGIELMKKYCAENNYPEPEFIMDEVYTTVIFRRLPSKIKVRELSEEEIKILSLLTKPRSSTELARSIGVSKMTVLRILKKLIKKDLIKKTGSGRRTAYVTKS